ncbi:hypothetical protein JTB14_002099 [Gonioctena quinquepunctata]|nr:hypothetical protein JTB14_002099 [Gonioctena quinquepunctata]
MRSKDVHDCTLFAKRDDSGLYPLPPNATCCARFLRKLRKLCILNPKNVKSKEFFRNKSTMLAEQKRHARSPYPYVVHPFSILSNFCKVIFFISWFWQFFTVPVVYGYYFQWTLMFEVLETLLKLMQFIAFLSFFVIGYVDYKNKEIIIEPKKIIFHYLRTFFIFDLIVVFYDHLISFFFHPEDLLSNYFQLNYGITIILLIAYLTRMNYFLCVFRDITNMLHFSKTLHTIVFHLIAISSIIHIFTCLMFSIPKFIYGEIPPKGSWMAQASIHELNNVPFKKLYAESLLLTFCFFFGATHEKYTIQNTNEEIISAIITMFGRLYTLYIIADVLKMFGLVGVSESKYEQYLGQLEEYMSSKNLPDELRVRLLKYYDYKLQKHYFNENQILATLSDHLKTEMFLFGVRKLLENAQLLKNVPKSTLGTLIAFMKSETYLPTDVITKAGAKVEDVFFISSGTVAVINSDDNEILHLEEGDEFGFLTSPEGNTMYTHIAVEISEVYYVSKKVFIDFLEHHPEIFRYFESRMKRKIGKYNEVECNLDKGGNDVLSSLRAGKLLEKQHVRTVHFDTEY